MSLRLDEGFKFGSAGKLVESMLKYVTRAIPNHTAPWSS